MRFIDLPMKNYKILTFRIAIYIFEKTEYNTVISLIYMV